VQRVIGGIQINNDLETILGQAARTLQQKGVFDRLCARRRDNPVKSPVWE
jgi:hypothetical protein